MPLNLKRVPAALLVTLALILSACGSTSDASAPESASSAVPAVTEAPIGSLPPDGSPASLLDASSSPAELKAAGVTPQVSGTPGHLYGYSQDNTTSGSIVGASRVKSENVTRYQASGTTCAGPIYQPLWINLAGTSYGWVEMGTAHWCNGTRSWYGFSAWNFNSANPATYAWNYNIAITGTTTHTFAMERNTSNCNYWAMVIDGSLIAQAYIPACTVGVNIQSGLESYTNWAVVYGPGTASVNHTTKLWNGASSYWWQNTTFNAAFQQIQMYASYSIPGYNSQKSCQNVALPSCGI